MLSARRQLWEQGGPSAPAALCPSTWTSVLLGGGVCALLLSELNAQGRQLRGLEGVGGPGAWGMVGLEGGTLRFRA